MAVLCLLAAGCSGNSVPDEMATARHNLGHFSGCDANKEATAVAAAAGPHPNSRTVLLEDWTMISVCHLDTLLDAASAAQKPVTLYVQGVDSGVEPSGVDLRDGTLTFVLDRTEENKRIWQPLLYDPIGSPTTAINVSVGLKGERALVRANGARTTLTLQKIVFDWYVQIGSAFLAIVIIILLIAASRTDLLREGPTIGGVKQPLSLGRTQMAWWFMLVLTGYIFIWLVTGDRDTIPPSLLGLMGISAATALAAVAIGSRGEGLSATRRKNIDAELIAIAAAMKDIKTQLDDPDFNTDALIVNILKEKNSELEGRRVRLLADRATLTTIVEGGKWWQDLVTDDSGAIGLDRLQIIVWTIVLGMVFLYSVFFELTMPVFSTTLLALMGISSGTYIGFKLPALRE